MDKAPKSNREFDKLTNRFLFFSHDSNDNYTEVTKKYKFKYSHIGFLILDGHGNEFDRIEKLKSFQFDKTVIADIEAIEKRYVDQQSSLVDYLESMLSATPADTDELNQLVNQLGSESFVQRKHAENRLTQLGSLARSFLVESTPSQPEARLRTRRILETIAPLEKIIERYELSRSVPFLARHAANFPNISSRLQTIVPDVELDSVEEWWEKNSESMQWDEAAGRYVSMPEPAKSD